MSIIFEHSCESPYIQGWKLEMMAEQVFDRYIENADKVIDLSYAMLEKHILYTDYRRCEEVYLQLFDPQESL